MRFITIVFIFLFSFVASAQAQVDPSQVDNTMRGIQEAMRDIEQALADASQEPPSVEDMLSSLDDAQGGNIEALHPALRELLMSHPELLAELLAPEAGDDQRRALEDNIRRMLYSEEDGLTHLLENNPEILERLVAQPEHLESMIQEFAGQEDDLEHLFNNIEGQMLETESEIARLIELVEEAQQSMASEGSQSQNEGDSSSSTGEGAPEPPQGTDEQSGSQPGDGASETDSSGNPEGTDDPNAWTADLPERAQEAARDAASPRRPEGWEDEIDEYYRLLARLSREYRERRNGNR